MKRHRIKYEKILLPALALSAACHLLAALVPAGTVDYIFHRDLQPSRAVRFEVVELREEPLKVIAHRPPEPVPDLQFMVAGTPPLPKIRDEGSRELTTVDIGSGYSPPPSTQDRAVSPPVPPSADRDSVAHVERYLSGVLARIEQARRYPESARRMGQQGSVQVSFAIGRDGQLVQPARLMEPSPFGSLNRAACNSVQRSTPFSPLPSCIQSDSLDITVRIDFQLQ